MKREREIFIAGIPNRLTDLVKFVREVSRVTGLTVPPMTHDP